MRSRRKSCSHACVRSRPQRYLPRPLPVRYCARRSPVRSRNARRCRSESRRRRCVVAAITRNPWIGGIASIRGSNCVTSEALAPAKLGSGLPLASVMMCCLVLGRSRSVGYGSVFLVRANCANRRWGDRGAREIDRVCCSQLREQQLVHAIPCACSRPISEPSSKGHTRTAADFGGQVASAQCRLENEQDAG